MNPPPARTRAPQMGRDARREMIVARTLDLLLEHGRQVTTRQIAEASGIGEGTIFRVFSDKEELLHQCLVEAVRMEEATARVAALPVTGPLRERLTRAATVLQDQIVRAGTIAAVLDTHLPRTPGTDRDTAFAAARDALVRLVEPDRSRLTHPPEQVAVLLIGLLFERSVGPAATLDLSVEDLVSIVLHGTLTSEEEKDS